MKTLILLIISQFAVQSTGQAQSTPVWMSKKYQASLSLMLRNISPEGAEPGIVIASPSQRNPNYLFHWVRDAALVMNGVMDVYLLEKSLSGKATFEKHLIKYAVLARKIQTSKAPAGLGEPKFHIDGKPFQGPWGRPQFDGPGLRAAVLSRLAASWLAQDRKEMVARYLWNPKKLQNSVIRTDLEFILKSWRRPSFDVWEEVKGIHFFTLLAQRKAMKLGAKLAFAMGAKGDARRYRLAYKRMSESMKLFWKSSRGIYVPTISQVDGIDYKRSGLDSSIFVAANFAEIYDGTVGQIDDPRMIRTFFVQQKIFSEIYGINQNRPFAPVIGRYPEDRYNGVGNSEGNPWFLTTHNFGEYLYNLATLLKRKRVIKINKLSGPFFRSLGVDFGDVTTIKESDKEFSLILKALFDLGDSYLMAAQRHTGTGYRMAEQINRRSGFQQGARDLTWSYASYVSAYFARHRTLVQIQD